MSKIKFVQLNSSVSYCRKNFYSFKFVCKCLLLTVSGVVCLCLLINTIRNRKQYEYNEFMYENEEERQTRLRSLLEYNYRLKWNHETVYLYEKELGLLQEDEENAVEREQNDQQQTNYDSKKGNNTLLISNEIYSIPHYISVACAFPGNTIHDHMWEYLSLWAIQNQYTEVISTVSVKTNKSLQRFLDVEKQIVVINEIKVSDYDLAYAKIIGHTTPILPIEISDNRKVPLILEKFAKRYTDIINADVINLRQFIKFNRKVTEETYAEMNNIKIQKGFNATSNVQWIGMHIDNNFTIPMKYYQSAITYFMKRNSNTIFIVILPPDVMLSEVLFKYPYASKSHIMQKATIGSHAEIMEFSLLSLCNGTIISDANSALHALLNGGVATFYKPNTDNVTREYNIPYVMGRKINTWMEIT